MRLSQAMQASVPRQTLLSSPAWPPCPQNRAPGSLPGPAPFSHPASPACSLLSLLPLPTSGPLNLPGVRCVMSSFLPLLLGEPHPSFKCQRSCHPSLGQASHSDSEMVILQQYKKNRQQANLMEIVFANLKLTFTASSPYNGLYVGNLSEHSN